jgi:FKBP-type peptidyl-prolyl cis-trans isomerase
MSNAEILSQLNVVVLKEGAGPNPPQGARVQAHYTGTFLDGKKFDSSVDRGQPFQFVLGAGQVIKAWDVAVASMTKGQKIQITSPPQFAYGSRGAGGVIPPNSTLKFEIELLGW